MTSTMSARPPASVEVRRLADSQAYPLDHLRRVSIRGSAAGLLERGAEGWTLDADLAARIPWPRGARGARDPGAPPGRGCRGGPPPMTVGDALQSTI